ncbi:MAG: hypothetical protein JWO06_2485 [Bacteroidota bacterium]|nr:hypothetical protein [Bacteroidota bacterium]
MKRAPVFLIAFFAIYHLSFSQNYLPYDTASGKIAYKAIIKIDSLNTRRNYQEAVTWLEHYVDTVKSSGNSELYIQKKDEDSAKIVSAGKFQVPYADSWDKKPLWVYYNLIIEAKNGRSRIKITDLQYDDPAGSKAAAKKPVTFEDTYYGLKDKPKNVQTTWLAFFSRSETTFKSIISSYQKYMTRPAPQVIKDEW